MIDVGTMADGRRFIVMEYLHGRNLEDLLYEQLLGAEDATSILLQTCSALDAAHRVGIVHRDLKPENVFLVHRPSHAHVGLLPDFVKLLDLGIAKLADPIKTTGVQTSPGVVMGTPQYMSPEQVERPTRVDRRSDIYSLGCVIYRIFAGRPPFVGSLVDICIAQRSEIMPPALSTIRADLDPRWDEIVRRCLRYEPEARYQEVKALGSDLIAANGARGSAICQVAWPRLTASPDSKTYRNPGTFPTPPPCRRPLPRARRRGRRWASRPARWSPARARPRRDAAWPSWRARWAPRCSPRSRSSR